MSKGSSKGLSEGLREGLSEVLSEGCAKCMQSSVSVEALIKLT